MSGSAAEPVPTLAEWAGGLDALRRLTATMPTWDWGPPGGPWRG